MRRKFILVGLLLAVFVFPYVLIIGEVEAQVGVKCINFKKPPKRLQCFRQKVRRFKQMFMHEQRELKRIAKELDQCHEDLHTVEPPDDVMEHNLTESRNRTSRAQESKEGPAMGVVGSVTKNVPMIKAKLDQLVHAINAVDKARIEASERTRSIVRRCNTCVDLQIRRRLADNQGDAENIGKRLDRQEQEIRKMVDIMAGLLAMAR